MTHYEACQTTGNTLFTQWPTPFNITIDCINVNNVQQISASMTPQKKKKRRQEKKKRKKKWDGLHWPLLSGGFAVSKLLLKSRTGE